MSGSGMESAVYDAIAAVLTYEISDSAYLNRICRKAAAAAKPHLEAELADTVARLEKVVEALKDALIEEAIDHQFLHHKGESIKRISLTPKLWDALAALDTEP